MGWLGDPTAFGVYIVLVGVVVEALALRSVALGVDSKTWPVVEGRVTSSRLDQDSDGQAAPLLDEFPVGGPVVLRYNPSKPRFARVRPGVPWETWMWVVIGFGALLLGVGVLQGWVEPS